MFPLNELATPSHIAGFAYPVKSTAPEDDKQDWEMGGTALNNPSDGLLVQLWKFTLVVDEETTIGSVYVEAPSVAATLLFADEDIAEIAGAFDQNMNPVVAYMQSGNPMLWWWDPTAGAMVHTALPGGCFDLRVALDDKRAFNVSDSDVILSYVRGGSLYYRYERERYATEHLLKADVSGLISIGMNVVSCFQWRYYGEGDGAFTDPFLGDILYDLCRQSGYLPEQIDVSECYDPERDRVAGIVIDSDEGLDVPIGWLMDMFQVFKVDSGKKTKFKKMGGPVVARIPFNKLLEDFPKTLKKTEKDHLKLPRGIQINHIDPNGGFAKNMQRATRRTNMLIGDAVKTITTKVVMSADQTANAAWRILKKYHNELNDFEFSTRLEYAYLEPGDVVEVEDADGTWYRMHLQERNEDDGNLKWEAEQDGGYLVYDAAQPPGKELDPPVSSTPGTVGDTEIDIFNIPVQNSLEDELTLHIGARGEGSGWDGYGLYFSPDGVIPYSQVATFEQQANIGETVTALADDGEEVEVLVPEPLESVTADQLAAGFNRAIIGDEEVQYETATLLGMVDELYHYNLTGLLRSVLRTTAEEWSAGIRFAEVDSALLVLQVPRQYYGTELHYKAVSFGQSLDEVGALSYDFTYAMSQTEWAVGDVVVEPNPEEGGTGVKVSWTAAPRLGTFGPSPFESKYFRGYRLKFGDGFNVDLPPGTLSYVYEDAYDAGTEVTVEIWSLNEITGEGALVEGAVGGGGGGEEPGGTTPPPTAVTPTGSPASTTPGTNGGFEDDPTYPVPQPSVLGTNVVVNSDFSSPGLATWKKQNGTSLDASWSNVGKLKYEGYGSGDHAAYNYGSFYSVPIWPFARYTFTVGGKLQSLTAGTQIAIGIARGFSTAGGGAPTWALDLITPFTEYVTETSVSIPYTHTIDDAGRTAGGQYVIGTFMPVVVVRTATGELHVATADDVTMVITEAMPAMTELVLDNIDFPADDQTGWTRYPYVLGLSAELDFSGGFVSMAPTDPVAVHSYIINEDKLNNHASWAAGHRIRITWKSWCNDPTSYGYITTNGSASGIQMAVAGSPVPQSAPGWLSALFRGDYTEYEFWMELPLDSATADAYLTTLLKTIVGKEVRAGDWRIWITDAPAP